MQGIHSVIRNEDQRDYLIAAIKSRGLPFQCKVSEVHHPKTLKQIRYAHSLCNAVAAYKQASPEDSKRDAKVAFGVITVCTSLITGDRGARLKSFSDYTRDEMAAFIEQMHVYLDENQIPYTRAKP